MRLSPSPCSVETLYSNHHGWLQAWLRRRLGHSADAADLAHDTFVRLMSARRPAHLGAEPRALLTCIAKGLVIDLWRRREVERAYAQAIAHLPEPEVPGPEVRLQILQALTRVDAVLHALPARTRRMFLMAQLDGLTLREIAEHTATPLITVRRHLHKALMACLTLS